MTLLRELTPSDCIDAWDKASADDTRTYDVTPKGVRGRGAGYLSNVFAPVRRHRSAIPEGEARFDAYPENTDYQDSGCSLAPSCLDCPFTKCRYDLPRGAATMRTNDTRAQLLALIAGGMSAATAARRLHISTRAAMRHVAAVGGMSAIRPRTHRSRTLEGGHDAA